MKYLTGSINKICCKTGIAGVMLFVASISLDGCDQSVGNILPVNSADVVVERFYGYISEAKISGGSTPLREAYKLISSKESHLSMARFVAIASKYPPGFKADVTNTVVNGLQARVTIAYKMQSAFSTYMVTTDVPLKLDNTTNTWKIDFTGEMDGQDKLIASKGSQ